MRSETATVVAHPTIRPRGTASMARGAMRVLHRDPKTGEIKIRVENADDLWHLHNLVQEGDLVRASTYRREDVKTDKVRPERGEKVRVTLTIRVEGVEFQAFSTRIVSVTRTFSPRSGRTLSVLTSSRRYVDARTVSPSRTKLCRCHRSSAFSTSILISPVFGSRWRTRIASRAMEGDRISGYRQSIEEPVVALPLTC